MKRFKDWFLNELKIDLSDPLHNIREICKHLVLLEDHLCDEQKRCPDCVLKHLLAAEALADEAIALDKNKKHESYLKGLPAKFREIHDKLFADKDLDLNKVCQEIRSIRKNLMPCLIK